MTLKSAYHCLNNQKFYHGEFSIVPIRYEDRYDIMKWRNEQIYHLRQGKILTKKDQDIYFSNIISILFKQENPDQILFSYLKNGNCIGYGGLVKINWVDNNAEISFLMNTELEELHFEYHWSIFLKLIQNVAFQELCLHKIYTYAYDLRPRLYEVLDKSGFKKDAILKEHIHFNSKYIDVHIDYKLNDYLSFENANLKDLQITYKWAIDPKIRKFAINKSKIDEEEHEKWFIGKISSDSCHFYIVNYLNDKIGSFRLDKKDEGIAWISYLLDPKYHGKGLGRNILEKGIEKADSINDIKALKANVYRDNQVSKYLFSDLGFFIESENGDLLTFKKLLT